MDGRTDNDDDDGKISKLIISQAGMRNNKEIMGMNKNDVGMVQKRYKIRKRPANDAQMIIYMRQPHHWQACAETTQIRERPANDAQVTVHMQQPHH